MSGVASRQSADRAAGAPYNYVLLFTSGLWPFSTGTPFGATIEHGNYVTSARAHDHHLFPRSYSRSTCGPRRKRPKSRDPTRYGSRVTHRSEQFAIAQRPPDFAIRNSKSPHHAFAFRPAA